MLKADFTASFARDRKRCAKKQWSVEALDLALALVASSDEVPIPSHYNDHGLTGDLRGYRELHIGGKTSNWVLLYQVVGDSVYFVATGSHDEVFDD